MLGRGATGRPWIAAAIEAALDGRSWTAPRPGELLDIALDHFRDSLRFYGDRLGLKIFRKHLAAYIEHAPWSGDAETRRAARARLCRLEDRTRDRLPASKTCGLPPGRGWRRERAHGSEVDPRDASGRSEGQRPSTSVPNRRWWSTPTAAWWR